MWFVLWLLAVPIFTSAHFYFVHRLLHWPPLYARVHALHHRSINIGPWSGLSMHPVESLIYASAVLIHFVVPSHPVIFLVHLYIKMIGPAFSHAGFESLLAKDTRVINAGDFHHQLHHRFFECNYGTAEVPWDRWFGSFHDGTERSDRADQGPPPPHGAKGLGESGPRPDGAGAALKPYLRVPRYAARSAASSASGSLKDIFDLAASSPLAVFTQAEGSAR